MFAPPQVPWRLAIPPPTRWQTALVVGSGGFGLTSEVRISHGSEREHRALKMPHQSNPCWSINCQMALIDQVEKLPDQVGGLSLLVLGECHVKHLARLRARQELVGAKSSGGGRHQWH